MTRGSRSAGRVRAAARVASPLAALTAALWALPGPAAAQQITHLGASADVHLTEIVEILEPWRDAATREFLSAEPRDVEVRLLRDGIAGRSETIHLLLFGAWGCHHYTYVAHALEVERPHTLARRTERLAFDVDDDGENEIVFVERVLEARLLLDEMGDELPEAGPFLESYQVRARYLDRSEQTLLEQDLPTDPEDARFRALLEQGLPDPLRTALQQAAGDADFAAHRFEGAAYRYRTVREWAERALPGGDAARLGPAHPIAEPDPDDPVALWLAAHRREAALPPAFRRP